MNQNPIDIDLAFANRRSQPIEQRKSAVASLVEYRPLTSDDRVSAVAVARSLPEWFNALGIEQITEDLRHQMGAVAEVNGDVVGFVTWCSQEGLGEIGWIAVIADHHRHGIGARLLEIAEDHLRNSGVTEVQVETLGDSIDYEPYERTRAFYRAVGFRDFKRMMTGNPGMPESLTLQKALSPHLGD
jgi:ribosomal protein S18 acetylase RimI-like enzyme